VLGQAGPQGGQAGDVHPLGALRDGAADDDVLDLGRVQALGPAQRLGDGGRGHVVGAGRAQGAPRRASDGGAGPGDDDGFLHGDPPRMPAAARAGNEPVATGVRPRIHHAVPVPEVVARPRYTAGGVWAARLTAGMGAAPRASKLKLAAADASASTAATVPFSTSTTRCLGTG
jgi:hypothetical protein